MYGNGIANIVAAIIVALALLWSSGSIGGFGGKSGDDYAEWYARAVGDIRNDIVINCGCCGDEKGVRKAQSTPFTHPAPLRNE